MVFDREGASDESRSVSEPIDMGSRWYVFRCIPHQEAMAEAHLGYQSFTYFLPKILVTTRHARRFVTRREWLFPRYGFVYFDIDQHRWRSVNGTYGVERLVMGKYGPQPVPHGIVEALQSRVDVQGLINFDDGLERGTSVRVTQGPLTGAIGVLQALDGKGRVELLLELLSGEVRAKLGREWVEAIT